MVKYIFNIVFVILLSHIIPAQEDNTQTYYGKGWSAVHADGSNSDYSAIPGPRNVTLAWQHKFEGSINLGPTNDETGRVYITTNSEGCHLYVLDNKSGEIIWCTEEVNRFAVASSALLDREGRIFIADNEAMHAFDNSGKLLWGTPVVGFPFSAQFTQTGRIIFITHIGRIYILDRKTGENILAPVDLIPELASDPVFDVRACMRGTKDCPCANTIAFDQRTGRLFFTFWDPYSRQAGIRAMQYSETPEPSIHLIWRNDSLQGGSASSPDLSANGSRVYVNDNMGNLYSIDAETGRIIWQFELGYETGGSQSTSPEGLIMPAGGNNAPLKCIAERGAYSELMWQDDEIQNRGIAAQAAGGLAYITDKTGRLQYDLVIVETSSGIEIDREKLPGSTLFSVGTTIGIDGYIYVPTFNGYLFAFRPENK